MRNYLFKYLYVLGERKASLVTLVLLFIILSFLDLLGIGLIGPFVAVVTAPETLSDSSAWRTFSSLLPIGDTYNPLVVLGIIIVLIFYAKSYAAYWVQRRIVKFSYSRQSELISILMAAYQEMPYEYYIQRNSSSLIQTILRHTEVYTAQTLIASLRLMSDIVVLVMILVFLAVIDIMAMLSMGCLLAVVAVLYDKAVKHRISRAGKEMADAQREIIKGVTQGIGGLKEIRLLHKEAYFRSKVTENASTYAKVGGTYRALTLLPRYCIEATMITFVVGLTTVAILTKGETGDVLPTLGVFFMAAIRLMPAGNMIVASINDVRYSKYAVDELYHDLAEVSSQRGGVRSTSGSGPLGKVERHRFKTISMERIAYKFPARETYAIEKIDVVIHRGQSVGLVGKSGCGKSTLVDVLLGFLEPQEGAIIVDGVPIDVNVRGWRELFAYIPQDVYLVDDTIQRNIALGVADRDINEEQVAKAVRSAQLMELVERLPEGIQTLVGERGVRLSGGEKQRVALARAFFHEREIIVMDEATSALDSETEEQIVATIKALKGKKTLIIIAHRLTTVRHCDIIYRLEAGKIVGAGDFAEVVGEA